MLVGGARRLLGVAPAPFLSARLEAAADVYRGIWRTVGRRGGVQVPSRTGRRGGGGGGGGGGEELRGNGPGGTGEPNRCGKASFQVDRGWTRLRPGCENERWGGGGGRRLLDSPAFLRWSECEEVRGNFSLAMKSVFFSRFFILLPWVLIVIIMIDVDSKRTLRAPAAGRPGRAQRAARSGAPGAAGAHNQSALPVIYAITPTYTRPVQKAELTRLAHAFRQVPRFHWILVEDSTTRTDMVTRFLAGCGVPYTHLHVFTPRRFKRTGMPRATEQRNAALAWLRQRRGRRDPGVVFFADDDNTYSLELFEEMRSTRGVSVWPVGFVGGRAYERPLVSEGKVVGWYTGWRPDRPFATDMAGFAVNLQVILANPRAQFKRRGSQPGMQESDFLKQITKVTDLEPKANNCTRVLVWHTRTEKPHLANEPKHRKDSVVIEV